MLKEFQQKLHAVEQSQEQDPVKKLNLVRTQIQELELNQDKLQKRLKEKQSKQNEENESIQQYKDLKRSIQDCLDWRKAEREEQKILDNIQAAENLLEAVNPVFHLLKKSCF